MSDEAAWLTVCIPTYNRPSIVATVGALLPQLREGVQLKIFDNCSDTPVAELIRDYCSDRIEVVRNRANVGASANVIKCFEHCETEWAWLLSDDDVVAADAISTIVATIGRHPDVCLIKYSADVGSHEPGVTREVLATGQADFIGKLSSFGNLLFLSTTVCRVGAMRRLAKDAYYFTASFAPHLALSLAYLAARPDAQVLFSPLSIVRLGGWEGEEAANGGAANWNGTLVFKSLAEVLYAVEGAPQRRQLFAMINASGHFYRAPLASLGWRERMKIIVLAGEDGQEHNLIAEHLSTTTFAYWAEGAPSGPFLLRTAAACVLMGVLRLPLVSRAARFFIRTHPPKRVFYYNKYSLFNKDGRL